GIAFGFSQERTLPIDYSEIEFPGPAGADELKLIRDAEVKLRPGEQTAFNMTFQLVSRDVTFHGMSGGLVVDRAWHFAGLVFGRRLDRYNIIIPADTVLGTLDRAGAPQQWPEFGPASFEGLSPFKGTGAEDSDASIPDRIDWGTIDGLIVL